MPSTTVTINEPGLVERHIHGITVESTAEIVRRDSGVNLWYALLVDGRHYDLVMWKHTIGRPQHMEALDRALAQVEAAISALNPQPTPPAAMGIYNKAIEYDRTTHDYAMYLDGELVGFARTYHEAEVTLDQLVFELISGRYFREAV